MTRPRVENSKVSIARGMRRTLETLFPLTFIRSKLADKRPLKIGIHRDIAERAPYLATAAVKLAITDYTHGPRYASCMIEGADRVDLDGKPAGVVSATHAAFYRDIAERWAASKAASQAAYIAADKEQVGG